MRNRRLIGGLLIAALAALAPSTQAATGQSMRVGFVDMSRIDEEAPQIAFVRDELQAEFAEREHDLMEKQGALRALEQRLIKGSEDMDLEQRLKLERQLQRGQRSIKRMQEEFRDDSIIRKNEEMEDLTRYITNTIRDFARAEKFDLILLSGVVYASDSADVTERILEWLTQRHEQDNDSRKQQP